MPSTHFRTPWLSLVVLVLMAGPTWHDSAQGTLLLQAPGMGPSDLLSASEAKSFPCLHSTLSRLYLRSQTDLLWAASLPGSAEGLRVTEDGCVLVWLQQPPGALTDTIDVAALLRLGARVAGRSAHFLEAWVPVDALPRIRPEVHGVSFVRPPAEWIPCVVSEGVAVSGAGSHHAAGYVGSGTKVAVVDTGFMGLANAIAAGELPLGIVAADFSGQGMETGGVHGTACLEIVHDMAPGAQLYAVKIDGILLSSTENAANYCIAQGIDVACASLGLFHVNFFDGAGPVCDLVDNLAANNVLPVLSAGNFAGNGSDAHHEGTTTDSDSDRWHEFAPGDETMHFSAVAGAPVSIVLNWDRWPATDQDYDLYIWDSGLTGYWAYDTPQTGTQEPLEGGFFVPPYTGTYHLTIWRYSAIPGIRYEVYARGLAGGFEYPVAQSSLACPGDAVGALTVGAIGWHNWSSGPQEFFSSQGPTNDGRLKPEICGPDAVDTLSYGTMPFYGTSAAAPHVAGAAALFKSAHPLWTAADVRSHLLSSAVDMGVPGADNVYGYGRLEASCPTYLLSVGSSPLTGVAISVSPLDNYGLEGGTTGFTREYYEGVSVSLLAPANSGDYVFRHWDVDGVPQPMGNRQTVVAMDGPHTATAQYLVQHFPDVSPDHQVYAYIEACYAAGIVQGFPDGLYHPEIVVTRGQMAIYIARALAGGDEYVPPGPTEPSFPDVPNTGYGPAGTDPHWAYKYVEYAVANGVVQGYPDGTYGPDIDLDRGQMAIFIARALAGSDAGVPDDPGVVTFADVQPPSVYYKYVEYIAAAGVTQGYPDGLYHPEIPCSRDLMAIYVARAFQLL